MKKAQMAFRRATVLDSSPLTLNDAAYFSAEAGLDLRTAEEESSRAVTAVEKQLNAVKLEQVNPGIVQLLARAAAYWDTLGWIKFKRGDLPGAEKYLRAAADLTDEATIQMHMGRVQEALGNKEAAMRFYVTALNAAQVTYYKTGENGKTVPLPPRPLTPDETAARDHLAALAGGPEAVKEQIQEGSYNRNSKRTVVVPNQPSQEQTERFVTLVAPGPKIASSAIWPGLKDQPKLLARFADKTPPQTFPDDAVTSIPRVAVIHCLTNPTQCEFQFLPIDGAEPFFTDSNHNE
jgi:tetratricopeptide (TPR) repeat protein